MNYLNKPRISPVTWTCSIWPISLVFTHPLIHASFLKPSHNAVTQRAIKDRAVTHRAP